MLVNQNVVSVVFIVTLTYFDAQCLGYHLLPHSSTTLTRKTRQTNCRSTEFACISGGECLALSKKCDGRRDCADGSDESYECTDVSCPEDAFRCNYGACVDSNFKCNGQQECADGSDEDPAICAMIKPVAQPIPPDAFCPAIEIDNGQYEIIGQSHVPGSPIPNYSLVQFTCNTNYTLDPDNPILNCVDGNWGLPVPQCKGTTCPPRISSSVDVTCTINGKPVDCSQPLVNGTVAVGKCKEHYKQVDNDATISRCSGGSWDKELIRCEPVTCPPRISSSVDVTCTADGKPADCSQPLVDGTVAVDKCKEYYKQDGNDVAISRCSGGKWDKELIRCKPECGKSSAVGVFVIGGQNARRGEFPWHIALYRFQKEQYEYKCGGSIITPLIIITAAHCFTDESGAERYPAEEYYVGAGKYYSNYNANGDKDAQKSQINEYHIPPDYRGFWSNYAGDLAVGVLKNPFQMTDVVLPVCVDWDNVLESQQLKFNNTGSVVGWGYVDPNKHQASEELKQLNAPYIDKDRCFKVVPEDFQRWITPDKFCAGFTNGASVCHGDSGGGMVFDLTENNRLKYYIRGLVSVGPVRKGVCDNFQYGVYTRISHYKDFIVNIIDANSIID